MQMEVFSQAEDGNYILSAIDMWDGERKILWTGDDRKFALYLKQDYQCDFSVWMNSYYRYSVFSLNNRFTRRKIEKPMESNDRSKTHGVQ